MVDVAAIVIDVEEPGWREAVQWAGAFVAGFTSEQTRRSYRRDLECWLAFCASHSLQPFRGLRRTHLEVYLRQLEALARAVALHAVPAHLHAQLVVPVAGRRRRHRRQPGCTRAPAPTPPSPQFTEELASTEAQLRDTTAAIDRYLHAFETGGMPEAVCAPRLEELAERRQELLDHRDELAARVNGSTVWVPERQDLEAVGALLRETIKDGTPAVIKDTLASLIATVDIGPGRQANPYFFVTQTNTSPTPETDTSQALGTRVRMDSHQVEKTCSYTNFAELRNRIGKLAACMS